MSHPIEVYLTKIQFKKYNSGKSIQLTKSQIELNKAEHLVKLNLSDKDFKKLTSNLKNNKGFRFKPDMAEGSTEAPSESSEPKEEQVSKKKRFAKGSVEAKEFMKSLRDRKTKKTGSETKKVKKIKTSGVKRKRFAKGSIEAKEYMAGLRGRKKVKVGEILEPVMEQVMEGGDIKSITRSIKRTYNNKIKPVLKSVSKPGKKLLENGIVAGIDVLTENPIIGEISRPLIKRAVIKSSRAILGVGVKHDKHPTHPVHYGHIVGGTPMSNEDIRNKKIGGSFAAYGSK